MIINILVKTNAKKDEVKYVNDIYYVHTKSPATEGKANISVIYLLSKYLDIPQGNMRIKLGFKSRTKVIEVLE